MCDTKSATRFTLEVEVWPHCAVIILTVIVVNIDHSELLVSEAETATFCAHVVEHRLDRASVDLALFADYIHHCERFVAEAKPPEPLTWHVVERPNSASLMFTLPAANINHAQVLVSAAKQSS